MPRRTPQFSRFIATAAVLGAIGGVVVSVTSAQAPTYGRFAGLGYFGLIGAILGGVLGAVVAVLLDRRS